MNEEVLDNALITPMYEKYPLSQNGICAFIKAPLGSGKSYTYLKLSAYQEVLFNEPHSELIVICFTRNKFDETVNNYKILIKKSKLVAMEDVHLLDHSNKYMELVLKRK